MKIYTKTGDDGTTGLFGGERVPKHSVRIEAYGTVDELNSSLGVARALGELPSDLDRVILELQETLFVLGADLATPLGSNSKAVAPRIGATDVRSLEALIDKYELQLQPLTKFILPGGSTGAALLQLSRTIARRAERLLVALSESELVGAQELIYLNRLSDLLFVLARVANSSTGTPDVEWDPKRS